MHVLRSSSARVTLFSHHRVDRRAQRCSAHRRSDICRSPRRLSWSVMSRAAHGAAGIFRASGWHRLLFGFHNLHQRRASCYYHQPSAFLVLCGSVLHAREALADLYTAVSQWWGCASPKPRAGHRLIQHQTGWPPHKYRPGPARGTVGIKTSALTNRSADLQLTAFIHRLRWLPLASTQGGVASRSDNATGRRGQQAAGELEWTPPALGWRLGWPAKAPLIKAAVSR